MQPRLVFQNILIDNPQKKWLNGNSLLALKAEYYSKYFYSEILYLENFKYVDSFTLFCIAYNV